MTAPKYREPKQDLATLILYLRRHASERDIAFTALAGEIADWQRREERKEMESGYIFARIHRADVDDSNKGRSWAERLRRAPAAIRAAINRGIF